MDTVIRYGMKVGEIGARILLWNPELSCVVMACFLGVLVVWALSTARTN